MVSPRRFQINPEEEALREKANETARIITGDPTAQGEVKDPARFLRHLETEQDINQVFKTFQGTVDQIRNDPALPQVVADEQRLRLERGLPPSVHLESSQNFLRGYDEWEKRLPESRPYVEPTGPGFTTPMVAPEKVAGFGRRTDPLGWAFKEKYGRELIGKMMGQFHSDFDLDGSVGDIHAIDSIFLGKKCYVDKLQGFDTDGNEINDYHIRMKGVPSDCIIYKANEEYDGDIIALYKDLYDGKELTFNLLAVRPKFEMCKDMQIITKTKFNRKISFK